MITLLFFFVAIAATAYTLGRQHEKYLADQRADDAAETARILHRPEVTVTDGGRACDRDHTALLAALDDPPGRHGFGRAKGTSAQKASWAADTREWPAVRRLFVDELAELEMAT